jgi:ABC-type phosphate transport system auxiliary subunit
MLIATLLTLLFLGSNASLMLDGIDRTKDNIKAEITDEATRKAALDIVDNMMDTSKDYEKADIKDEKELIELIQRYESTTAELKSNMDASFQQRIQYQQEMLVLRFKLKDQLSRVQWEKVFSESNAE